MDTELTVTANPLLSICIPAYNRAEYLPQLLDSIEQEIATLPARWTREAVEVVIADNASEDDTADVVTSYRSRFAHFEYVRHTENLGADRNYLAVVAVASGRFCWLMGSDDKLESGALQRVLEATAAWTDCAGFSVNVAQYDFKLRERLPAYFQPVSLNHDQVVTGADAIFQTFAMHYGYLSGQVVWRELWNEVVATDEQMQYLNAYVHVFVIGRMLQRVPRWGYVHQRCVGYRAGNDSFLGNNWVRRLEIDLIGYRAVAEGVFGPRSPTALIIRDQVARRYAYGHYLWAKLRGESSQSLRSAGQLLYQHFGDLPVFRSKLLPWILLPNSAVRVAYRFYSKLLRPRSRSRRLAKER